MVSAQIDARQKHDHFSFSEYTLFHFQTDSGKENGTSFAVSNVQTNVIDACKRLAKKRELSLLNTVVMVSDILALLVGLELTMSGTAGALKRGLCKSLNCVIPSGALDRCEIGCVSISTRRVPLPPSFTSTP